VEVLATEELNVTVTVVLLVVVMVPSHNSTVPLMVALETDAIRVHVEGPPPDTPETVMALEETRTARTQALPTVGLATVRVVTPVPRLAWRVPTAEIDTGAPLAG